MIIFWFIDEEPINKIQRQEEQNIRTKPRAKRRSMVDSGEGSDSEGTDTSRLDPFSTVSQNKMDVYAKLPQNTWNSFIRNQV